MSKDPELRAWRGDHRRVMRRSGAEQLKGGDGEGNSMPWGEGTRTTRDCGGFRRMLLRLH
jgi:hypothetical protein